MGNVWGVGLRIAEKLQSLGIQTAWDLRQANVKQIKQQQQFSVVLERTVLELRGTACIALDDLSTPKQNIITSHSLGQLTGKLYDLQEAIRVHVNQEAEKLRRQNSVASAVLIFLKTNRFREDVMQYHQYEKL